METLNRTFQSLLRNTNLTFQRQIPINWENRMIAIVGARGVGKTTFLLQHIKKNHLDHIDRVLYTSLDNLYFYEHQLLETIEEFYLKGGRFLFLDEVHKYDNWSRILKNIYDSYTDLKVIFTSSSILDIYHGDADLSRRVVKYEMNGMSFREYLQLTQNINLATYDLHKILNHQEQIFYTLPQGFSPLAFFNQYLEEGYFPFTTEPDFLIKLNTALNNVIEIDLAKIENLSQNKVHQIKQVLGVIAESVPFKPNISKLSQKLNISRDIILSIIYLLEKAKIINLLQVDNKGISKLQKPDKIFLENTNLMYALKDQPDIGNIRETFFYNQLKNAGHTVLYSKATDFKIDENYHFEIGGPNKKQAQIKGLQNAFVVKDKIEVGQDNILPLWMFGLLY